MYKEVSYGIIPFRQLNNRWYVLLIQHGRARYWGFPKGHPEEGEDPKDAAARELLEETGLKVIRFLSPKAFEEFYKFKLHGKLIDKTVAFFSAEVSADPIVLQKEEVSDYEWVPVEEAENRLTYPSNRKLFLEALSKSKIT